MRTRSQAAAAVAKVAEETPKKTRKKPQPKEKEPEPAPAAAKPGASESSSSKEKPAGWDPLMDQGPPGYADPNHRESDADRARRLPPVESLPESAPRVDAMVDADYEGEGVQVAFMHHDHGTHTTRTYPDMESARKMAAFIAMTYGISSLSQLNNWLEERKFEPFPPEHMMQVASILAQQKKEDIPGPAVTPVIEEEP